MRSFADLAADLACYGMPVLATGEGTPLLTLAQFTAEAALHPDSRLRIGLMALWLAHPNTARAVPEAAAACRLQAGAGDRLPMTYQASVYLERLWAPAVALYAGRPYPAPPRLVDVFGRELGLPPADWLWGRPALQALAALDRTQSAGDPIATYDGALGYLELYWTWRRQRGADCGPAVPARSAARHRE